MHHDIPHGTEYPHGTQDIAHNYHDIPHCTEHPHSTQVITHNYHDIPHSTELAPPYCTHVIRGDLCKKKSEVELPGPGNHQKRWTLFESYLFEYAPLLADLFLYSYENEFLDSMIRSGHRRLARSFNLCYRYIDDLIVFNNKRFLDYLKEIYPSQLTVEKANKLDHLADYLDLTFIIDSAGKLSTRLYDKPDDFDFHIVNFPYVSSNIPSGPSYGVYISQLIRYAQCCSHYDDFRYRHKCLVDRLLSQGYIALRLEKSFKKFYGRYQDLIEKYQRSVNVMVNDSFPG